MDQDFTQLDWDEQLADDCRQLIRLAIREDLDRGHDLTTVTLVDEGRTGGAAVTARRDGVVAGLRCLPVALDEMEVDVACRAHCEDGQPVRAGQCLAELSGAARELLTSERILLNLLSRLSGIASLTQRYVQAVAEHPAAIYDTRKTTPGWRRLEKYAVRCGGGRNHRTGLFDAVLIKDNHLALARSTETPLTPPEAVLQARQRVKDLTGGERVILEIEVDDLEQLQQVLPTHPDIVLLDNMTPDELRRAVTLRNAAAPETQLEASGGIDLSTVTGVAATGIDRISVGALTHSATALDIGLDWL